MLNEGFFIIKNRLTKYSKDEKISIITFYTWGSVYMSIKRMIDRKIFEAIILFVSIFMLVACGGSTKEYMVTFNSMGGTAVEAITIEDGKTLELPAQPTRTGYTFDAWYLEESLTTPWTNLVISSSITVYAKWIINTYTITFNTDGGTSITNASVSYNQTLTEPTAPTKVGYTFAGWFTDANKTNAFAFTTPITQNITLYAKFTLNTYTVSFITNGGDTINAQTIYHGSQIETVNPLYTGHRFLGWFTDQDLTQTFDVESDITSNLTLYAKWEIIQKTDEQLAHEAIEALNIPHTVNSDLTLPMLGLHDTRFSWSSNKPHLISATGQVLLSGYGSGGEIVTLTMLSTKGAYSTIVQYEILVEEGPEPLVTSKKSVDFVNVSTEYVVTNQSIEIFFINDQDMPFVDIESFMKLVHGAILTIQSEPVQITDLNGHIYDYVSYVTYEMIDTDIMSIKSIKEYSQLGIIDSVYVYEAILDFTENTFYVESYEFFSSMVAYTQTNYGEGLYFGDSIITPGQGLLIPLSTYRFDLVIHIEDDQFYYLMPLPIANLLFLRQTQYQVYYNGDMLYGVDTYQFLYQPRQYDYIKTSSLNNQTASIMMKMATYDYLALSLDLFYGLKDFYDVESFYEVLKPYANDIIYADNLEHYKTIYDFIYALDDLHTSHRMTGYYINPYFTLTHPGDMGQRGVDYYLNHSLVRNEATKIFPGQRPLLRITPNGQTAIITINSFTYQTPSLVQQSLDTLLNDYPDVENVIIDLSTNTGGIIGSAWRTLGFLWDDVFYAHYQNVADRSTLTYQIYDTYPSYDYEWFILTSSVTYSAANHMASIAKELGMATIIGFDSSGGASPITVLVLPTGTVMFMSSSSVISTTIDGEYVSIEFGVEVDYQFDSISHLYDDLYLERFIQTINLNQS